MSIMYLADNVGADGTVYPTIGEHIRAGNKELDELKGDIDSLKREFCDVISIGAKGDGVTDDSEIIQFALNNYDNVFLPFTEKGYAISKPLVITKPRTTLSGANKLPYFITSEKPLKGSCIIPTTSFSGRALIVIPHESYGCNIKNISLSNDYTNVKCTGLEIGYSEKSYTELDSLGYHTIKDVMIYKMNGVGIIFHYKCWDNYVENVNVKKCSTGFQIECTDSVFVGCYASSNTNNGFIVKYGANSLVSCKAFFNGTVGQSLTAGFVLEEKGYHTRMIGCNSQQNKTNGVRISTSTNVVTGLVCDGNGYDNPNNYNSALIIEEGGNIIESIMIIPHWLGGCVRYGINIKADITNIVVGAIIKEIYTDEEIQEKFKNWHKFVNTSPTTSGNNNSIEINCNKI